MSQKLQDGFTSGPGTREEDSMRWGGPRNRPTSSGCIVIPTTRNAADSAVSAVVTNSKSTRTAAPQPADETSSPVHPPLGTTRDKRDDFGKSSWSRSRNYPR